MQGMCKQVTWHQMSQLNHITGEVTSVYKHSRQQAGELRSLVLSSWFRSLQCHILG